MIIDACIVCGKPVPNYIPEYCCGEYECNCRGLPIEPPVCSDKCWGELTKNKSQQKRGDNMPERIEFEMAEKDLETLLESCKPVPYMIFGGREPRSPQENANSAWELLGSEMGFDHMTVEPISGKGNRFFTAEKGR